MRIAVAIGAVLLTIGSMASAAGGPLVVHPDNPRYLMARYDPNRKASFTTWLVAVVSRLCTDYHRDKYGRARGTNDSGSTNVDRQEVRTRLADLVTEELNLERMPDGERASPEGEMLASELVKVLHSALAGLDDRDRLLLALRFEDGVTARDIAPVLDFPSQFHVYRRLKVVLARLRESLEAKGFSGTET